MRDWELRVCPNCGHDHVRSVGEHTHGLPCSQCGTEMISLRLVLAPGERTYLKRAQRAHQAAQLSGVRTCSECGAHPAHSKDLCIACYKRAWRADPANERAVERDRECSRAWKAASRASAEKPPAPKHPVCSECDIRLREPSESGLCGFCLEERELAGVAA